MRHCAIGIYPENPYPFIGRFISDVAPPVRCVHYGGVIYGSASRLKKHGLFAVGSIMGRLRVSGNRAVHGSVENLRLVGSRGVGYRYLTGSRCIRRSAAYAPVYGMGCTPT